MPKERLVNFPDRRTYYTVEEVEILVRDGLVKVEEDGSLSISDDKTTGNDVELHLFFKKNGSTS